MKTLGLIGGTSWVSTIEYYKAINEGINNRLGGLNFSECIIYSFNFQDIKNLTDIGDWDSVYKKVLNAANNLEKSGAKGVVLCANTLHYIAKRLEKDINIPIIHIGKATGKEINKKDIKKVGLLGTKFTMEYDFIKSKLHDAGIETIIPSKTEDRDFIHNSIFEELGKGIIKESTKQKYLSIIQSLKTAGAQGIIAGCTEIPLIVSQNDIDLAYFDTGVIHCDAAVEFALK